MSKSMGIRRCQGKCHSHYWRDVGATEACRAAQQDALGRAPKFNLDNDLWPIWGHCHTHPAGAIAATRDSR